MIILYIICFFLINVDSQEYNTYTYTYAPINNTSLINSRRNLVGSITNTATTNTSKPVIKLLFYDPIKGYLNLMKPHFVEYAKTRCPGSICIVSDKYRDSIIVSGTLLLLLLFFILLYWYITIILLLYHYYYY